MLRELLAFFELGVDDKKLKSAHEAVEGFKSGLGTVAKAIAGALAIHEVVHFLGEQIKLGAELDDQAQRLGIAADELQRFQYAAVLSGVSVEGANHALMHLNKSLGEALGGGEEQAKTFAKLGVNIKDASGHAKPLSEIVPALADGFSKLKTPQEQTAVAMSIFGKQGAALIPLLKGGKDGVGALYEQFEALGGGLSGDFIQAAARADDELDRFRFTLGIVKSRIALEVLPIVTSLVQKLISFTVWAGRMTKETNVLTVGLYALVTVVGLLVAEWLILNIEIVAIVAAFAALFLIVEDIYTFFTGGDSILGRVIDRLFGVGASKRFIEAVKEAIDDVMAAFKALEPIVRTAGEVMSEMWAEVKAAMALFFKDGNEDATSLFDTIKAAGRAAIDIWSGLLDVVGEAVETLSEVVPPWLREIVGDERLKRLGHASRESAERLRQITEPPTVSAADAQTFLTRGERGGGTTVGQQTNKINVTVNGGPTNEDTGSTVAKAVKGVLGQTDVNAAFGAVTGDR